MRDAALGCMGIRQCKQLSTSLQRCAHVTNQTPMCMCCKICDVKGAMYKAAAAAVQSKRSVHNTTHPKAVADSEGSGNTSDKAFLAHAPCTLTAAMPSTAENPTTEEIRVEPNPNTPALRSMARQNIHKPTIPRRCQLPNILYRHPTTDHGCISQG